MQIETSQLEHKVRIKLQGILDEKGAEALKSSINQLRLDTVKEVEIDYSQVQHVGSSGIGKMLLLYKHLASQGGKMTVSNLPGPIFELFIELKMDTLFTITRKA